MAAEVVRPRPDRPFEGLLQVSAEITPMASFAYEYGRCVFSPTQGLPADETSGRSSDEEILISRLLEKAVRRSRAVDLEALCIVAGEQVRSSCPLKRSC